MIKTDKIFIGLNDWANDNFGVFSENGKLIYVGYCQTYFANYVEKDKSLEEYLKSEMEEEYEPKEDLKFLGTERIPKVNVKVCEVSYKVFSDEIGSWESDQDVYEKANEECQLNEIYILFEDNGVSHTTGDEFFEFFYEEIPRDYQKEDHVLCEYNTVKIDYTNQEHKEILKAILNQRKEEK